MGKEILKRKVYDTNYCIVIPFAFKKDYKQAIDIVKKSRNKIQKSPLNHQWYVEGLIIEKDDFDRLLNKSQAIEIVNEIEDEDFEVED